MENGKPSHDDGELEVIDIEGLDEGNENNRKDSVVSVTASDEPVLRDDEKSPPTGVASKRLSKRMSILIVLIALAGLAIAVGAGAGAATSGMGGRHDSGVIIVDGSNTSPGIASTTSTQSDFTTTITTAAPTSTSTTSTTEPTTTTSTTTTTTVPTTTREIQTTQSPTTTTPTTTTTATTTITTTTTATVPTTTVPTTTSDPQTTQSPTTTATTPTTTTTSSTTIITTPITTTVTPTTVITTQESTTPSTTVKLTTVAASTPTTIITTTTMQTTTTTPDLGICSADGFNPILFSTSGPSQENLKAFYPRGNPNDESVNPDFYDVCAARISIIGKQTNGTQLKIVGVSRLGNITAGGIVLYGEKCGTSAINSTVFNGTKQVQCMFAKYPQPINTGGRQSDLPSYPIYYDDDPLYDVVFCTGICKIVNVNKALREDFPHNIIDVASVPIRIHLTKNMMNKKYGFYCVTNQTYGSTAETVATRLCKQGMVEPTTEAPTTTTISGTTTVYTQKIQNENTTSQELTTLSKELNATITESSVMNTTSKIQMNAAESVLTATTTELSSITTDAATDMTSVDESTDLPTEISTQPGQMTTVEPESDFLLQIECT